MLRRRRGRSSVLSSVPGAAPRGQPHALLRPNGRPPTNEPSTGDPEANSGSCRRGSGPGDLEGAGRAGVRLDSGNRQQDEYRRRRRGGRAVFVERQHDPPVRCCEMPDRLRRRREPQLDGVDPARLRAGRVERGIGLESGRQAREGLSGTRARTCTCWAARRGRDRRRRRSSTSPARRRSCPGCPVPIETDRPDRARGDARRRRDEHVARRSHRDRADRDITDAAVDYAGSRASG